VEPILDARFFSSTPVRAARLTAQHGSEVPIDGWGVSGTGREHQLVEPDPGTALVLARSSGNILPLLTRRRFCKAEQ
jgi:hypothetical protein